jgi:opacity protein-like surface antigen
LVGAIATMVLGVATAARADAGFSVGVEGGVMEFDSRASLNASGIAWGLRGGVGFLGPTRLEARFLSASQDMGQYQATLREGDAQIRVSLIPNTAFTPYAFGGVGLRTSSTTMAGSHGSDSAMVVPLGAGLDVPLGSNVIVAPEFTWHHRLGVFDGATPPPADTDSWHVSLVLRLDV